MGSDGYDVFVSYSRSDGAGAAELNSWLCSQGLSTFFDRSKLHPGLRWVPALEDAIGRSRAIAILFGEHGIGNTQQYERELALVRQTREPAFPVIPVLMPGFASPPTGFLQLLTWVDLSKGASVLHQPESLSALRAALHGDPIAPSELRASICPYRGLETFREEDAPFFCGRVDAISELVAQVRSNTFVAVVGPSGSGKSSLVFAGLLPALRRERQTRTWDVVSLRPGKSPLFNLAEAFGSPAENAGPAQTATYLEKEATAYRDGDAGLLAHVIDRRLNAAPEKPDRLLIYVDQWEELYAMAPPAEDKDGVQKRARDVGKFIALLAAASAKARASVVLTVRADFYNPLIRNPLLSALLPRQQVNIKPMRSDELRSAIETPAKKAGLSFAPPELIDQILSEVGTQEGRLPLLQFALKETWERREGSRLTAEAYTAVGGVIGAIEKTAEAAYDRLNDTQKDAARRLFLRLVTPGEGQEDTRARSLIPNDPQQLEVIKLFSDPKIRLLVTGLAPLQGAERAGNDGRATVEVAHEALIQRWPTLQTWVNANREKLRARAAILRAMAEWEENAEDDRFLLDPGVQLERGRALLGDPGDVPVDDIRDFVDRSIKREDDRLAAERAEEDAQRQRELANQKRIAEAERQAREAAEDAANQARARAAAEADLRATAEQKALLERQAREAAEDAANQAKARAAAEADLRATAERARTEAETSARKLQRALLGAIAAAVIAGLFLAASVYFGKRATDEARETQRQLDRANRALAESINNDLGLEADKPLTSRQRDALWKLAAAAEPVKSEFVSILAKSPNETVRASPGFAQISRALGLLRPSAAEAENLVAAVVGGLQSTNETRNAAPLVEEFKALAPRITEAQAGQALDPLLKQIGQTTDPDALRALAQALQALPVKLSEAQAGQALDPLLEQIGQTTDSDALRTLAQALQALPVKLSEAQAGQALDPLLEQIGQTTDPDALRALAQALQALAGKLSEAQAGQALDPLLKQIGQTTTLDTLRGAGSGAPGSGGEAERGAGEPGARSAAQADRPDNQFLRASGAGSGAPGSGGEAERGAGGPGARSAAQADRPDEQSRHVSGAGSGAPGSAGEAERGAGRARRSTRCSSRSARRPSRSARPDDPSR